MIAPTIEVTQIEAYLRSLPFSEREKFVEELVEMMEDLKIPHPKTIECNSLQQLLKRYERKYGKLQLSEAALCNCVSIQEFCKLVEDYPCM